MSNSELLEAKVWLVCVGISLPEAWETIGIGLEGIMVCLAQRVRRSASTRLLVDLIASVTRESPGTPRSWRVC